ncbi:MAG: hypothetical protein ABFC56_14335 [Clostridiaceae bacterium]
MDKMKFKVRNVMMDICDDEKIRAADRLLNELAKGRTSGEEKGWHSLEEAEAKLGSENQIYLKLCEAEAEARSTNLRFSHKKVMSELRKQLSERTSID